MKEAISNSLILAIIITFFTVFIILFAGSTSYTKAFKVKNKIVSIIEKYDSIVAESGITEDIMAKIDKELGEMGYRTVRNNDMKCENAMKNRFKNQKYSLVNLKSNTYRYCIAEFVDQREEKHGKYYAVIAYMYFEIPLIGTDLEFPVYGETKVIGMTY